MSMNAWNWKRPLSHLAAAAVILTAAGCGQPQTLAPMAASQASLEAQAQSAFEAQEDEPGWRGPKSDLGHFFKVDETLFRGQQPTDKGLAELKAMGVKTVVYLHFNKKQAAHEKAVVESQGMRFVHIPMSWITPPKPAQIDQWLKLTSDPANQPVFVHCQHGKDRTGAMVGIYRLANDGWSFDQAYKEMKEKGFRSILVGLTYGVKRYANLHEAPASEPALAGAF